MKMRAKRAVRHRDIEASSGNVFKDLELDDADAMLVKAKLAARISELLAGRGLTQTAAASLLGIPQPKLSKLLRGHFHGTSERKLMDFLTLLGSDVEIVVRTGARKRGPGRLSVTLA